jgi:hypothetical protein
MSASSVERIPAPMGPPRARGRTLPQMALIAIGVGVLVVILRMLTTSFEHRIGVYGSGIVTAVMFVGVGLYSVRKRNLWFSLRMLYMARRIFPASIFGKVVFLDRLETWRATHVVVAMLALLPFWWHMQRHLMGPLEAALASAVALLYTSGLIGVLIQDRLPHYMTKFSEHEVRTQDVNSKINAVYVEAEENVLGHSEEFTKDYLARVKPVLLEDQSSWGLFMATIAQRDLGENVNHALSSANPYQGDEARAWREMAGLATRKVNLEQNDFNLWLSISWLRFHIIIAALTFALLAFHILAVLYYGGA